MDETVQKILAVLIARQLETEALLDVSLERAAQVVVQRPDKYRERVRERMQEWAQQLDEAGVQREDLSDMLTEARGLLRHGWSS